MDGLKLKTPIAFQKDSNLDMIPIRKEGTAVCEKCGAIGVQMGHIVVDLGGGRRVESDAIDPAVGIDHVVQIGAKVAKGDVIARVHANRLDSAQMAVKAIDQVILIDESDVQPQSLILEQIGL